MNENNSILEMISRMNSDNERYELAMNLDNIFDVFTAIDMIDSDKYKVLLAMDKLNDSSYILKVMDKIYIDEYKIKLAINKLNNVEDIIHVIKTLTRDSDKFYLAKQKLNNPLDIFRAIELFNSDKYKISLAEEKLQNANDILKIIIMLTNDDSKFSLALNKLVDPKDILSVIDILKDNANKVKLIKAKLENKKDLLEAVNKIYDENMRNIAIRNIDIYDMTEKDIDYLISMNCDMQFYLSGIKYHIGLLNCRAYHYILKKVISPKYNIPYNTLYSQLDYLGMKNENIFETVNYQILNVFYADLYKNNTNLLIFITTYPEIQDKIIKLSNSRIFVLKQIINYININYKKQYASYIYLVLDYFDNNYTFYSNLIEQNKPLTDDQIQKIFIYVSCNHNYQINNIDELDNLNNVRNYYCDAIFNNENSSLDEYKDASLERLFGISLEKAKIIERNFTDGVLLESKYFDEKDTHFCKILKEIVSIRTKEEMKAYNEKINFDNSFLDINLVCNRIKNVYIQMYNRTLFKTSKSNWINQDDGVDIYSVGLEFAMIVHVLYGYTTLDKNYNNIWNNPVTKNAKLCTSYIRNDMLATAPIEGITFGFSDFEDDSLLCSSNIDINSNVEKKSFAPEISLIENGRTSFLPPELQISCTRKGHNEMIFKKWVGNKKRKPAYVIYKCDRYDKNIISDNYLYRCSLRAAKDLNIPLVIIEQEKIMANERGKISNSLDSFIKGHRIESKSLSSYLYDIVVKYQNNFNGKPAYKYENYFNQSDFAKIIDEVLNRINELYLINPLEAYQCNIELNRIIEREIKLERMMLVSARVTNFYILNDALEKVNKLLDKHSYTSFDDKQNIRKK